jgi:hypothetical protein
VDRVCCDDACDGQCEACDVDGVRGTCSPVSGEPHGNRDRCDGDDEPCRGECQGDVTTRGCVYAGLEQSCGSSCEDGFQTDSACDGHGACVPGDPRECDHLACQDESTCKESCDDRNDCLAGYNCIEGRCEARAVCASHDHSQPAEGLAIDCTPYACDDETGVCHTECSEPEDCSGGNTCFPDHQCKPPEAAPQAQGDESCSCSLPGRRATGLGHAAFLALLAAALFRRRRSVAAGS